MSRRKTRPPGPWRALALLLVGAVFVTACRGPRKERDPVGARLAEGDALYARRANLTDLDAAIAAYLDASGMDPTDVRPMERLARAYLARGYGFPSAGVDDYSIAREYGMQCLFTPPGPAARLESSGGRITAGVVSAIGTGAVGCLSWTTLAWARWIETRGVAGAGLDLDPLNLLVGRAVLLDGAFDGGRPYEAQTLSLALPPLPLGPDLSGASAAHAQVAQLSPGRLTPVVDHALWVLARGGAPQDALPVLERVARSTTSGGPDELENLRARQRARTALQGSLPAEGDWIAPGLDVRATQDTPKR